MKITAKEDISILICLAVIFAMFLIAMLVDVYNENTLEEANKQAMLSMVDKYIEDVTYPERLVADMKTCDEANYMLIEELNHKQSIIKTLYYEVRNESSQK